MSSWRNARDRYVAETGTDPSTLLVAGSVGSYGAMLADGSEYRGDYDPGRQVLRDVHAPRMETLLEAGADLLALETIPSVVEAEVLVVLVGELGASAWLSYQCRDAATTAAGEPVAEAFSVAADVDHVIAVGVNCLKPRFVPALLEIASAASGKPGIAYPNGGDTWDAAARTWIPSDGDRFDPGAAATWGDLGAAYVGGCCGTGPADIAVLAEAVTQRGPRRVTDRPARPRSST